MKTSKLHKHTNARKHSHTFVCQGGQGDCAVDGVLTFQPEGSGFDPQCPCSLTFDILEGPLTRTCSV